MSLLPGEDALLVASGGTAVSTSDPEASGLGSVVVATSKGFVRFLSSSGIQRYIWRIGEEMVSMAAGREAVLLVHREGGTSLDGTSRIFL
jgi:chromosome transmission fidelity protein 4